MSHTRPIPPRAAQASEGRRARRRFADQTAVRSVPVRASEEGVTPCGVAGRVLLRRAIAWFADTPRSAEAFLTRFRVMPKGPRRALTARFDPEDPWRAYREVCRLYGL